MKQLKKLCLSLAALALFVGPAMAAPQAGEMAPDFEGVNVLTGETFKLSEHKGETVVLEWTNHQCPFVVKHYDSGNMQMTQEKANEMGVTWVTIISSAEGKQGHISDEEAVNIVEEAGASPDAKIMDPSGEIGYAYGARTTPHMFVINEEGIITYAGAIDSDSSPRQSAIEGATNYVLAALNAMEAGEEVETASTQPYGCSVKYDK